MARDDPEVILGIDLGSTKVSLSVWTGDGRRLKVDRFPTPRGGPRTGIGEIARRARDLVAGASVNSIGVSAGGPTDPERGVILTIPNLPGWDDVPVASELSGALGAPVGVENDANACALAEWRHGAGRGVRDLVFMTFSTGLGAGLILDGRLYRGHRFLAGEVGHQVIEPDGARCGCGGAGCLEAYASGAGIRRLLEEAGRDDPSRSPAPPRDARELVERARRGDPFSRRFLELIASYLARGIAGTIFLLNPERIILGTIAVAAGDLLLGPVRKEIEARVWPSLREGLDIVPAALGADLGDYAAFEAARPHPDGRDPA